MVLMFVSLINVKVLKSRAYGHKIFKQSILLETRPSETA